MELQQIFDRLKRFNVKQKQQTVCDECPENCNNKYYWKSPRSFVPDETHIFEGKNNLYFYVPKRDWREVRIVYYHSKEHYNELIGMHSEPVDKIVVGDRHAVVVSKSKFSMYQIDRAQKISVTTLSEFCNFQHLKPRIISIGLADSGSLITMPHVNQLKNCFTVYNIDTKEDVTQLKPFKNGVDCTQLSGDAGLVATASVDGMLIKVFNVSTGIEVYKLRRGYKFLKTISMHFSPKSKYVVVFSREKRIKIGKKDKNEIGMKSQVDIEQKDENFNEAYVFSLNQIRKKPRRMSIIGKSNALEEGRFNVVKERQKVIDFKAPKAWKQAKCLGFLSDKPDCVSLMITDGESIGKIIPFSEICDISTTKVIDIHSSVKIPKM